MDHHWPPSTSPAHWMSLRKLLQERDSEAEGRPSVTQYRVRRLFPATAMLLGWPDPLAKPLPSRRPGRYSR